MRLALCVPHYARRIVMKESILMGKRILAVDDKPDVLAVLEKEILEACPDCKFETATTNQEAAEKMMSWTYDAVILDGMGTRDSYLLNLALVRNFPVVMLTTPSPNPEPLNQAIKMGTRVYLPKEKLGEIVSFLKHLIKRSAYSPGWSRLVADIFTPSFFPKVEN
jgi:DNA-binding NarL/FixJ family response regulator